VVHVAIELRQQEIVQFLLASGADINLGRPVWDIKDDNCKWFQEIYVNDSKKYMSKSQSWAEGRSNNKGGKQGINCCVGSS
jgi:hypothetical protein